MLVGAHKTAGALRLRKPEACVTRLLRWLWACCASRSLMDSSPAAPAFAPRQTSAWTTRIKSWAAAENLQRHEDKVLLLLTLIIGAVVGLVIAGFIYVTENLGARMYPAGGSAWRRLLIPTGGSLLTGFLLWRYFPNARGSGIPQTKTALFLRDGFISFRTVLGKFGCSSLSLASGIALGREGPSVHVGAGLASVLGRRLGLGPKQIRDLIPVGASAALAAAFNTPVAAVLFTLEEVMGDLHAPVLGSIVLSSATAWIVLHLLLGDEPLFHVPSYQLVSPVEFISYAALGVIGGLVSVSFVKLLLFLRKRFLAMPKSTQWVQPVAGGLLVGVLGWFVPQVLGVGYAHVSEALNGQMTLYMMALLVVLKLVATATCYSSGNAGGIFGPSLFIGAMMGGMVGAVAHQLAPDYTGGVGAYALVGMGAAFAGIVRVPLASVIMIFEMTRDYSIIVPLMISNLISFYISYKLQREPIYEALQHQDGYHLPAGAKDRQQTGVVRDAVTAPGHLLSPGQTFHDAAAVLDRERNAWPVADGQKLLGLVSLDQVNERTAAGEGDVSLSEIPTARVPRELLTNEEFPHLHLDHTLDVALTRMAQSRVNVLPVVSRADVRELQGVVMLDGILRAYGIGSEPNRVQSVPAEPKTARFFVPGVIAAAIGLLIFIGFLNYYYRAERATRAELYNKTASELAEQNRDAEAIEQLRNALSISPGSEPYRLALAMELVKAKRLDEASVYLHEVLKRDPTNGVANLGLARIAAARQRTSDAVTYYHRAVDGAWTSGQERNRIEARFELADYLSKQDRKTQALAELLGALSQVRDNPTRKRIGKLLLDYGSPRQSAEVFREVLRDDNADVEAYVGLGQATLEQDDYVAAQSAFRSALDADPSNTTAKNRLELCERILALDPDARNIRASERYQRSASLLESAVQMTEPCASDVQRLEAAKRALANKPRPGTVGDATETNLSLAVDLWRSRTASCPKPPDDAPALLLNRMSRH